MRRVAIDFDGTLHAYSRGWADGSIYDPPLPDALYALQTFYNRGYEIWIFTCRVVGSPEFGTVGIGVIDILRWLHEWQGKEGYDFKIAPERITCTKPAASVYIDDRGLRFTNWLDTLDEALALLEAEQRG